MYTREFAFHEADFLTAWVFILLIERRLSTVPGFPAKGLFFRGEKRARLLNFRKDVAVHIVIAGRNGNRIE
jgi:hypothetical protein